MPSAEQLLAEFRDAWTAGHRPRVEEYLARADPAQREALASLLDAFLQEPPRPEYSDAARQAIRREPVVQDVVTAFSGRSGLWPSLLPRLRTRARLRRDEVVERLVDSLSLPKGAEAKTRRYLHGMETGTLVPSGVSRRVLDVLAEIFGVGGDEIEKAGEFESLGLPPTEAAYLRSAREEREFRVAAADVTPPESEWDEVDRLFLGGRGQEP